MKAYLVSDNEVTDQALFDEFASGIFDLIASYGGKYLVRGGDTPHIDGPRTPHRTVIVEFESMDRAQSMTDSPEYHALAEKRSRSSNSTTFLVQGI